MVQKRLRGENSERGASLVMFTLLVAFVLVPVMGLGIDAATQYWIKSRLSSVVDSAALSAGRSLSTGSTLAAQAANAQSVGQQYFNANFPPGTMGTTVVGPLTISLTSQSNLITVTASARVQAPLYFMKMLHLSTGTVAATTQTTRRNTNIVLVLDRSGSMNNASNSCAALVSAVETFTNQFIDGRDQLSMVTFSSGSSITYQPSIYFKSGSPTINSVVNTLVCGGATSTAQAMSMAYTLIQTINQPSALNVILLFTDGGANTVVAYYPIKTQGDNRYDAVNTGNVVYTGPSGCYATDILFGAYTDFTGSLNPTGVTGGVFSSVAPPLTQNISQPSAISAPGCAFSSNNNNYWGTYNIPYGRLDVAYIPLLDAYGNATAGYKSSNTYTSGPYTGQIRVDSPLAIRNAAANATDSVSQKIRSNVTYNIVTYTIGLAGNESIPMDTDFLERLANDPRASNYNSSQPQGLFALATDNASLSDAFNAIASQILRISR